MKHSTLKEKDIRYSHLLLMLAAVPILFLIIGLGYAVNFTRIGEIIEGFANIILSPTILLTDFIKVGGIAAAFINVGLVGLLNLLIMRHYRIKINGVWIAAFFTAIGFSFFGKNLYNILPIYLGGFLYTLYQKNSFKDIFAIVMFGTALAPFISEISFSGLLPAGPAIAVAMLAGVFIGFVLVPLSSHMLRFHDGYNLYNIGFTSGIIGTVLTSVLRNFGVNVQPVYIVSEQNYPIILGILLLIFTTLMAAGLWINHRAVKDYPKIFAYQGRLITDFTHLVGYGTTFVNMSMLGFISLLYVLLIGGTVNGPVLAGIFTVVGFGAFGKHLKNCWPVMAGVIMTALFFGFELSATNIVISVLFSTTLAPIAGTYGPVIGFLAGILHMILVTNVGVIHGGINLYNNGFSGGLVAGILVPVVDAFKKE
ncbi:MAG: DUF1576 domain-containing protein [Negativicutes bacterium]|nr:DUF1576 domain-containing protein [Negativicutes bacterium]